MFQFVFSLYIIGQLNLLFIGMPMLMFPFTLCLWNICQLIIKLDVHDKTSFYLFSSNGNNPDKTVFD